ncbi:hypothetical protein BHE74_00019716 [Ensete ventricosum]|nr:hypothetical protein GW17_00012202 [Ensete ventricosum]RWW72474.1 hypothetical protein BHE74_00019716 [Ensete ventricosum]
MEPHENRGRREIRNPSPSQPRSWMAVADEINAGDWSSAAPMQTRTNFLSPITTTTNVSVLGPYSCLSRKCLMVSHWLTGNQRRGAQWPKSSLNARLHYLDNPTRRPILPAL